VSRLTRSCVVVAGRFHKMFFCSNDTDLHKNPSMHEIRLISSDQYLEMPSSNPGDP
jgi:hypothetical protein